jgi:hypothetical protein
MLLRAVAQSGEIVERMHDELLAALMLSLRCGGEKLYKILCLDRGLRPGLRRSGQEKNLEFFLTMSQGRLIGLNLLEVPTNFGRFLSGHAAVLVEVNRVVRHRLIPYLLVAVSAPIINDVSGGAACRVREAFNALRR